MNNSLLLFSPLSLALFFFVCAVSVTGACPDLVGVLLRFVFFSSLLRSVSSVLSVCSVLRIPFPAYRH